MQDWEDPSEFYGCGAFARDSWAIFCRGEGSTIKGVQDIALKRYIRWLTTGTVADAKQRAPRAKRETAPGEPAYVMYFGMLFLELFVMPPRGLNQKHSGWVSASA